MSIVYSKRLLSWQELNPGQSVTCYLDAPTAICTMVIRTFSLYFGGPSPVIPNSVVVIDDQADSGKPTILSYNSGETGTKQPIYETFDGFWPLVATPTSPGLIPMFSVVNTSVGTQQVDVYVGGWVLIGEPGFTTIINTP